MPVQMRRIFILGVAFAVVSCGGAADKSIPSSGGAAGASPTGGSGPTGSIEFATARLVFD